MPEYNSVVASVPTHLHAPDDIVALGDWQASIERSLAAHASDIDVLKKCIIGLIFLLCTLAITLLVLVG